MINPFGKVYEDHVNQIRENLERCLKREGMPLSFYVKAVRCAFLQLDLAGIKRALDKKQQKLDRIVDELNFEHSAKMTIDSL